MEEPRGPLSASIYRRRRIMAMAGSAVGALLFVWAIGALLGGNGTPSVKGTAPASNPPVTGRLVVRGSATSAPSASPSPVASPGPSGSPPAHPTTTATTTTTVTTPPPGPPQACPDSVTQVTVTTAQPSYPVGARPILTLHIANIGPVACIRDVSRQLRSIQVLTTGGTVRLWSSGDCYSVTTNEVRMLQPNQSLAYSVAWSGRTSAVGCPARRATVPAGQYELVGRLGNLTGPPTPITLN